MVASWRTQSCSSWKFQVFFCVHCTTKGFAACYSQITCTSAATGQTLTSGLFVGTKLASKWTAHKVKVYTPLYLFFKNASFRVEWIPDCTGLDQPVECILETMYHSWLSSTCKSKEIFWRLTRTTSATCVQNCAWRKPYHQEWLLSIHWQQTSCADEREVACEAQIQNGEKKAQK